jgi:threonine synthase
MADSFESVAVPVAADHVLRCIGCGEVCASPREDFRCSKCEDLLEAEFPAWKRGPAAADGFKNLWRQRRASNQPLDASGVWRFREMLPALEDWSQAITLREGNTPVYELPRCGQSAGVDRLLAKHQGMNPTGSFKDTGMTVAISFARQNGFRWVACASTGNTSASMAAYAAHGSLRSLVLIPEGKIAWGKLSQSLDYGALTCQLRTDFDGCVRVLSEVIRRYSVYLLNSVNPYRLEGQKTAAIELLEQLDWQVPDHIIVPGGNLGNNSALGKALVEMKHLGLIDRLPKVSVIQAEGANALYRTVNEKHGCELVVVEAETLATAIRIGNPASWKKSVRVLEATGGCVEQVSEAEIALAKAEIGSDGVGCEPASAVTLAGLKKLVKSGFVRRDESVVLVLTGHLLKDPEYTIKFHRGDLSVPRMADDEFRALTATQRKSPLILDASPDAVLRAIELQERAVPEQGDA